MTIEKLHRTLNGKVTSDKMSKTVTVLVERKLKHPLYGKYIVRSKKYHAHVEENGLYGIGDSVIIEEYKPISKTKAWKVIGLLNESIVNN
ncbi:MAG: 30S ribosomal protein S17 [Pseudomonadota bacterium]